MHMHTHTHIWTHTDLHIQQCEAVGTALRSQNRSRLACSAEAPGTCLQPSLQVSLTKMEKEEHRVLIISTANSKGWVGNVCVYVHVCACACTC